MTKNAHGGRRSGSHAPKKENFSQNREGSHIPVSEGINLNPSSKSVPKQSLGEGSYKKSIPTIDY